MNAWKLWRESWLLLVGGVLITTAITGGSLDYKSYESLLNMAALLVFQAAMLVAHRMWKGGAA